MSAYCCVKLDHLLTLNHDERNHEFKIYTVYLYLETALHVSGGTSTHHQKRIQLYLQHQAFVTPLPLPAAIMVEFQLLQNSGR